MAMRELPFGARVSESFVELLKEVAAKAAAEWPDLLPCLSTSGRREYSAGAQSRPPTERINFESEPQFAPVNRIAPQPKPPIWVTERVCVICFDFKRKHPPHTMFLLDGIEFRVDEQSQSELKGATLDCMRGKIVAHYETI